MPDNPILKEKLDRIRKAVALEPVDKIPFVPCGNAFFARVEKLPMTDYVHDMEKNATVQLNVLERLGYVDATQARNFCPFLLPTQWLCDVAIPGEDLGPDEMWQMLEKPYNVTDADYDFILENGFGPFYNDFLANRLNKNYPEKLKDFFGYAGTAKQRFDDAGVPCICDFLMITPFEYLCGGRSLEVFFMEDLYEQPDRMEKIFERVIEHDMPRYTAMFDAVKPTGVWVGGWRSAPEMISPAMFDRFVWPYMKAYAELALKKGALPIFHLDANWDLALPHFLEMPKGTCVLALDGKTDIYRAKELLGDHMCIMGDIKPELCAFGTPEEVYDKSVELIKSIGPRGFILATGCDIPSNAPFENAQMICRAAESVR